MFIIGVDLGQAQDFTAITVLELSAHYTGKHKNILDHDGWSFFNRQVPVYEHQYAVRHLERLPVGTPYPKQVEHIKSLFGRLQGASLVIDQTGVGRPVVDMLKSADLSPVAVTITAGDAVTRDGSNYRVPKRDLVSTIQVLLQSQRLKIASSLKEAQTLISELLAFKVNITASGHARFGNDVASWREAEHDDLVLAVALACWYGESQ